MTPWTTIFIASLAGAPEAPSGLAIEVQLLDGGKRSGVLTALTESSVSFVDQTPNGQATTISADSVMAVVFQGRSATNADSPIRVSLRGGGILLAKQVTSDENALAVVLNTGAPTSIALRYVSGVFFGKENDESLQRGIRQAAEARTSDRLIARRGNEQAELDGILGPLGPERLAFTLDGEEISVKRDRLVGLFYASEQVPRTAVEVEDVHGNVWPADRVAVSSESLAISHPAVSTTLPIGELVRVDYARQRVVYVSDIEPAIVEHTPFFDVAWPLKRDTSFVNQPLAIGSQRFAKGLLLHSRTSATYDLAGEYRRFSALVGIDSSAGSLGDAQVQVLADGRAVWESRIRADKTPIAVDVDVSGTRRLTLVVDFGRVGDIGDHVVFGDARLVK